LHLHFASPAILFDRQVYNLTTISLLEGQTYYVTVVAWNNAGPPLSINVSSKAVLVDTTGPVAGEVHNT
jgi:hypothetical protein